MVLLDHQIVIVLGLKNHLHFAQFIKNQQGQSEHYCTCTREVMQLILKENWITFNIKAYNMNVNKACKTIVYKACKMKVYKACKMKVHKAQ